MKDFCNTCDKCVRDIIDIYLKSQLPLKEFKTICDEAYDKMLTYYIPTTPITDVFEF